MDKFHWTFARDVSNVVRVDVTDLEYNVRLPLNGQGCTAFSSLQPISFFQRLDAFSSMALAYLHISKYPARLLFIVPFH